VEAAVVSSSWPTVLVRGWRSCSASASSSYGVQGWNFGRYSSSPSAAAGSMVEAVTAAVVRLVSSAHPVEAFFSRRSAPSGLLPGGGAVAVVRDFVGIWPESLWI
jgi:hypothetical protein